LLFQIRLVPLRNGLFRYTPSANFFGNDTFEFGVMSTEYPDQTFTNVVDVEVRAVNDVPILQNMAVDAVGLYKLNPVDP
jgi:hypothetical protein